jgi:hypothetical protein
MLVTNVRKAFLTIRHGFDPGSGSALYHSWTLGFITDGYPKALLWCPPYIKIIVGHRHTQTTGELLRL